MDSSLTPDSLNVSTEIIEEVEEEIEGTVEASLLLGFPLLNQETNHNPHTIVYSSAAVSELDRGLLIVCRGGDG